MKRNLRKHKVPEPIIAEIVKEFPSTNLISACQFKLSRVGDLNDLFDVIPSIKKPKMESVEAHLRRVLKRNVSQAEVKESFERQLRISRDPYNEFPLLAESSRLICLSSFDNNSLLWSHYASRHKGFAVGFRTSILRE